MSLSRRALRKLEVESTPARDRSRPSQATVPAAPAGGLCTGDETAGVAPGAASATADVSRQASGTVSRKGEVCVDHLALELPGGLVPREEDRIPPFEVLAARLVAEPPALVCAGDDRLLAYPLRADHDVVELEVNVGKCGEELGVEPRRAIVPLPASTLLARDRVDAVLGQRRDQSGEVAVVLGDRVRLPEVMDRVVLRGVAGPTE